MALFKKNQVPWNKGKHKKSPLIQIRTCICGCNKTFEALPCQKKKYFDRQCYWKDKPKVEQGIEDRICACGCGKHFSAYRSRSTKFASRQCAGKHRKQLVAAGLLKFENPFKNKTQEEKMAGIKKANEANKKKLTGKTYEEIYGKEKAEILKRKRSESGKNSPNSGRFSLDKPGTNNCKWFFFKSVSGKTFKLQGTYELRYAKALDAGNSMVKDNCIWTAHTDILDWTDKKGVEHKYHPDFTIYNKDGSIREYIDTKNYYLLSQAGEIEKIEAVRKNYPLYVVDLFEIEFMEYALGWRKQFTSSKQYKQNDYCLPLTRYLK